MCKRVCVCVYRCLWRPPTGRPSDLWSWELNAGLWKSSESSKSCSFPPTLVVVPINNFHLSLTQKLCPYEASPYGPVYTGKTILLYIMTVCPHISSLENIICSVLRILCYRERKGKALKIHHLRGYHTYLFTTSLSSVSSQG